VALRRAAGVEGSTPGPTRKRPTCSSCAELAEPAMEAERESLDRRVARPLGLRLREGAPQAGERRAQGIEDPAGGVRHRIRPACSRTNPRNACEVVARSTTSKLCNVGRSSSASRTSSTACPGSGAGPVIPTSQSEAALAPPVAREPNSTAP